MTNNIIVDLLGSVARIPVTIVTVNNSTSTVVSSCGVAQPDWLGWRGARCGGMSLGSSFLFWQNLSGLAFVDL